jgi:chemotaxis protein methyltransferase CheR
MIPGIEQVAALLSRESGIVLGPTRMPALAAAMERVAPGLDGAMVASMATGDRGPTGMLARLIDEVAVNETFFFRHRQELDAIDWPELARTARADGRDGIRAWSAGCASGEEAYTLAIIAGEAFASSTPPISILASDLSGKALDRARAGVYHERSVRLVPANLRIKHLHALGGGYGVERELRTLVRFRHHNLVTDPAPPADEGLFDLIVCRNVLIYFEPDVASGVLASLERALAPGGALLLGTADRLCGSAFALSATPVRARARDGAPERAQRRRPEPSVGISTSSLAVALNAADAGHLDDALDVIGALVATDPLHADAHYVRGMIELAHGDAAAAVVALRRSLYLEPEFPLAAFQLARAYDRLPCERSARRAYAQALRILEQGCAERPGTPGLIDDLEAVCRARLDALRPGAASPDLERPT